MDPTRSETVDRYCGDATAPRDISDRIAAAARALAAARTDDERSVLAAELTDAATDLQRAVDEAHADQTRAELAAARSRDEWERTFDALPDAIAILNSEDRIHRANKAFWKMARRREPALGKLMTELMHESPEEAAACHVCDARKNGVEGTMFARVPSSDRPDGEHFEVRLNRVQEVSDGKPGMVQVIRDITAVRAAEAEIGSRQAVLDTLLSNTADAIGLVDSSGTLAWGNATAERLATLIAGSMVGKKIWEFFEGETGLVVRQYFERTLAGEAILFEHQFNLASGVSFTLECTLAPVFQHGKVTKAVASARDITERRSAMERAAEGEKLRALGQLAAGVAHDFNNLLASILGNTQLIGRLPAGRDPETERKLAAIERAARDGAETVRRIQYFTRVRSDSVHEVMSVDDLLKQSVDLSRPRWKDQAQANGARIDVVIEESDRSLTIEGNGAELREVVTNLIFNAVDAMPDGGQILLSAWGEGELVRLRVRDTGHGIDDETRRRIFEPFFTTRGPQNSGLGLAVSYGIVARHGGSIDVESEADVATTFTVRLPMTRSSGSRATDPAVLDRRREQSGLRVLVVDDEDLVRNMLAAALTSAGAEVVAASSGREAISAVRNREFDVVLTDLGMPDVSGWDVARAVRAHSANVRILLLTGWGETISSDHENADAVAVVERVLAKPIDLDDLIAAVCIAPLSSGD